MIELVGDLGTGKTTLVQGVVHGLGFKGEVTSPTFTLSRDYPVRDGLTVHHFDMYRLSGHDIVTDELEEVLQDDKSITLVEWAQHGEGRMPSDRLRVSLSYGETEEIREVEVRATGPRAAAIVGSL